MRAVMVLVAVGLAVLLAGCSGSESSGASVGYEAPAAAPEVGDAADGAAQQEGPDARAQQPPDLGSGQPVVAVERQVVRTADLDIRVRDLDAAAAQARGIPQSRGGFLAGENGSSYGVSLTLRVATDQLDAALADLGRLGEVTQRSLSAQDVTDQTVDLQARIASQQASVDRLRALLGQAGTIGEVVQVESELTTRQTELESLQQRAASLAGQAALATITVRLDSPDEDEEPVPDESGFLWGLTNGVDALGSAAMAALTVLGALLPFLVVLGVPTMLLVRWLRRRRRTSAPVAAQAPAPTAGG